MERKQSEDVKMEGEPGQEVNVGVKTSPLQEFLTIKDRYQSLVEFRDGLQELFSKGQMWVKEQTDFEDNFLKRAMFLAFCEKINEQAVNIGAELRELLPKIKVLQENIKVSEKKAPCGGARG